MRMAFFGAALFNGGGGFVDGVLLPAIRCHYRGCRPHRWRGASFSSHAISAGSADYYLAHPMSPVDYQAVGSGARHDTMLLGKRLDCWFRLAEPAGTAETAIPVVQIPSDSQGNGVGLSIWKAWISCVCHASCRWDFLRNGDALERPADRHRQSGR